VPTPWKKLVLVGAGIGGGFAIMLAVIAAGWVWYEGRPHRDPDWNTTAIKATFKDVVITTSVPKPKLTFSYSLENTTASDYTIDGTSQVQVMATLPEGKGFDPDEALSLPASLYIPSKQKVVLSIFKEAEYNDAYPERDRDNGEKLAAFMNRRLKELDGFVLFDKGRRYKIVLPNGWPDVNKKEAAK
jgi:hypothetical protein